MQIQACTSTRASEVWFFKAKFLLREINIVCLGRAITSSCTLGRSTLVVRAGHGQSHVMSRAVTRIFAIDTVDQRDVLPNLVVVNGVFELRMLAVKELVRLADFHGHAALVASGTVGLGVSTTGRNVERTEGSALDNAPDPDIIGAAVFHDGIAGEGKGCLQSCNKEGGFEEHFR